MNRWKEDHQREIVGLKRWAADRNIEKDYIKDYDDFKEDLQGIITIFRTLSRLRLSLSEEEKEENKQRRMEKWKNERIRKEKVRESRERAEYLLRCEENEYRRSVFK